MDRSTIYSSEQGRSVDFLFAQRATMIAIGKLAQAALGSNTVVSGLAVTPNSPAALNVLVGIGEIYTVAVVDATSWGSLDSDADTIVQQGLNMAAQTISTPAPSTSGYSIAYLIEAQFQSQDTTPVVLPFFNSANPSIPLNGQGDSGATLPTERQGVCVIRAKAGVAATTGTQVTPTVDSGWTALAVVTVANGQSTVTSGNISIPVGVPQVSSLLQMMQTGSAVYAVDTSASANAVALSLTPAVTAYTDGSPIRFKAANSNTGPCTINWGGGSIALNGANGALQGGEIISGKQYEAQYNSTTGTAILLGQTAGALQSAPATASQHAVQFGQVAGVVGSVRNLVMSVPAASATATLTADEIVVETALGGLRYCLPSFNKTINLATTGAGGMDTGTAPVSGYVEIYAIWNPVTSTAALLAQNATSAVASNVYGGANMPSGYTASALVSVWQTNASRQFVIGDQLDRRIGITESTALSTSSTVGTPQALSISGSVPPNAKLCSGSLIINNTLTTAGTMSLFVYDSDSNTGSQGIVASGTGLRAPFSRIAMVSTPQQIRWMSANTSGTPTFQIIVSSYEI